MSQRLIKVEEIYLKEFVENYDRLFRGIRSKSRNP